MQKKPLTASLTGGANHEIIMVETRKILERTDSKTRDPYYDCSHFQMTLARGPIVTIQKNRNVCSGGIDTWDG
jgi:hypothetical protein